MANTTGQRRWPWLVLSAVGLLLSLGFLGLRLLDFRRSESPPAQSSASREAPAAAAPSPLPPPPPPALEPAKPTQGRPPEPEVAADEKFGEGALQVAKPHRHGPKPPRPSAAPSAAPSQRGLNAMAGESTDDAPVGAPVPSSRPVKDAHQKGGPAHRLRRPLDGVGTIGHGRTAGKRRSEGAEEVPATPEPTEPEQAPGPDSVGKLLRGYVAVKVPQRMLLKRPVRVHVVIADRAAKAQAEATVDALPTGGLGPAQISGADLLIGKQIQIELRALPSEFEILAITPQKQPVHRGQVTEWSWTVVPLAEGEHELSVVVTNLTDKDGRVYNVKVHEVAVTIEVQTMDKLRAVASTISSAVSGLASLFGAWMGLLRPLLQKRREKDEAEAKRSEPAKSSGPDPQSPDPQSPAQAAAGSEPAATSAATDPPKEGSSAPANGKADSKADSRERPA